ncbi:MAG: phosphoribosylformimino-5-aminoimidazole carboxamide ribotide isomerase [Gaiellales bacterium]|nr:phosphoribosylformimino-5-aminoimidazole carboxamide ribotide isomerase [Gaiellales bacterium]
MAMEVIPAVDLSGGRVVRLLQGDYGRVTGFDETPDEAADRFALAGAGWLHVIDLDAARDGERSAEHAAVFERLSARRGIRLQVGGGFRSPEQVEAALAGGVQRVLIGTLAARDPDAVAALAADHGPRICVCADALDDTVRVAGWREDAGESAASFVERFSARGVSTFLVTAIERDGTLSGPDLRLLAGVRAVTDGVLLAAGGFAALEHVAAARDAGCDGAVVGRALYDGSLNLREALTVARDGH